MLEVKLITICRDCKKVFYGIPKGQMRCPNCRGWNIMLLSNSGIVDAVIGENDNKSCEKADWYILGTSGDDKKAAYGHGKRINKKD